MSNATTETPIRTMGLVLWMQRQGYGWCARRAVQAHLHIWGTLEGAPDLEAADRAEADAVLEGDQDEVPYDDPAWGDGDGDLEMDPDFWRSVRYSDAEGRAPAPICGGAPADDEDAGWEAMCDAFDREMTLLAAEHPDPTDADWDSLYADRHGDHASPTGAMD